jgi:hypothetical protein
VGDVLRVEVAGGRVIYRKNGAAIYTSTVAPAYPLLVDTSLSDLNASLVHVMISSASSGGGTTTPTPSPAPSPPAGLVNWTNLRSVTVDGNVLRKTGGCFGCADASAVSAETFSAGVSMAFTAVDGGLAILGFTRKTLPGVKDFDFALRLNKGVAEVRENGVYRSEVRYVAGDLFEITMTNGRVTYARNGVVFRTITPKTFFPVHVGAMLYLTNGWIQTPSAR